MVIEHIAGEKNDADIFTKNVTSAIFERHVPLYVGNDEYASNIVLSGEPVSE